MVSGREGWYIGILGQVTSEMPQKAVRGTYVGNSGPGAQLRRKERSLNKPVSLGLPARDHVDSLGFVKC